MSGPRKSSGIASRSFGHAWQNTCSRTIKKGAHVLVEGKLVSSTYEQPNGKGKKAKTAKITSWSIRADVVRKLDRGEPEPEANPSASVR